MSKESLKSLARDLTTDFPRSPREKLGGYVVAARTLDKCRASLAGCQGEYHFNCPLDKLFLDFAGIEADAFEEKVASGAGDAEMADWIRENGEAHSREAIVQWNNDLLYKRLSEMPIELQLFLEDYIPECLPKDARVIYWFDVYDIEEKRL